MQYNELGRTGLQVSALCLGTMTFGDSNAAMWKQIGTSNLAEAQVIVDRAIAAGINFFDTADSYHEGQSEEVLGQTLAQHQRDEVVICTKVGFRTGPGPNNRGLSRGHIIAAVEASLRRLRTDHIDLYTVHRRDPRTPVDETMAALDELVEAGKVRYIGVSNWPAWQMADAEAAALHGRGARFETCQVNYSLVSRDIERELVPFAQAHQVGITAWSPLAGGVLTGKYRNGSAGRANTSTIGQPSESESDKTEAVLQVLSEVAAKHQTTMGAAALAWLLAQRQVTAAIIGVRNLDQLNGNLSAIDVELTEEDLSRLSEVSALKPEYPAAYNEKTDWL